MDLLAELLPEGLLQRTDRQASVVTAFTAPLSSGAACSVSGRPQIPSNPEAWTPQLHFGESQAWPFPAISSPASNSMHQTPVPPSLQEPSTHPAASLKHSNTPFPPGTLVQATPLPFCAHPGCTCRLKRQNKP